MRLYKIALLLPFITFVNGMDDMKALIWGHDVVTKARALGIPMPSDPDDRGVLSPKEVLKRDFSPETLARQQREFEAAQVLERAGKYDEAFRAYMHLAAEWNLEANWRMSDIEFHGGMGLRKREGFYLFGHRWRVIKSELAIREGLRKRYETTGSYEPCTWMAVQRGLISPPPPAVEEPRRLSTESAASAVSSVAMSDGASRRSSGGGSISEEAIGPEEVTVESKDDTAPLLGGAAATASGEGLRHRKVKGGT